VSIRAELLRLGLRAFKRRGVRQAFGTPDA
jgi:hypothetical protein